MGKNVFCTVMTPTYNRANLLFKLYNSLRTQTIDDFEWIIVDDGSVDDTEKDVKEFIKDNNNFNIKYLKKENGGKHTAINYGIDYAKGKVLAIVDSDDYLLPEAIEIIKKGFEDIESNPNGKKFAGISLLKAHKNLTIIGSTFAQHYLDAKSTERRKYNINGDKFEVFYTSILKKNKFPEIKGEKFMTEAILWTRLANLGYCIRWYNDIGYICEYLDGGLTDTRSKLIEESPKGYAMYIKEQVEFGNITLKQKLGLYSYYGMIRKKSVGYKCIAKELNTNCFMIIMSIWLRKLLRK